MYFYLYIITNILDGKVYIGQTVNSARRWNDHKWLSKNKQEQYIHRAMNKYSVDNFIFEVIATCRTQKDVDEVEKFLISQYDSRNNEKGYNISPGGDIAWNRGLPKEQQPMYGKKQSEFQKQRMSEVHAGKTVIHSEEWRQMMSNLLTGRKRDEETIQKISISNKGLRRDDETRKRMSTAKLGIIMSDETKKRISDAKIGKTKSDETKKKMSKAKAGENSYLAKLNWKIVEQIRSEYATELFTQKELGKKYNISRPNINSIINNKTWRK